MKISIENTGAIQKAQIELHGLTVIAGENDTGKSTIGKILFALVQAFSNYPDALRRESLKYIRRHLELLYFEIRRNVDIDTKPELRELIKEIRTADLVDDGAKILQRIATQLNDDEERNSPRTKAIIAKLEKRLNDSMLDDSNKMRKVIHQALKSEFMNEIVHKRVLGLGKISLSDGASKVAELTFDDKSVHEYSGDELLGIPDATLVEGPFILQFNSALDRLALARGIGSVCPFHIVDLTSKLQAANQGVDLSSSEIRDLVSVPVSEIVAGAMFYDRKNGQFVLERDKTQFKSENVASGVKALTILQMLASAGYISDGSLLILDEPETNLHPKWQIKYAKIVCDLVRVGVRILVTTHSPYILEALKKFSSDIDNSKFYFATVDEETGPNYIDTLGDISMIIESLSTPLLDLIED